MKNFTSVDNIDNLQDTIAKALKIKENPLDNPTKGKGKTIGLVFCNANDKNVLRILPALNITEKESDLFINALEKTLKAIDEKKQVLTEN